ncbi:MAG: baseplate wedge protein 53, partial [Balneolaceae bacterium]|nr:baseplate wedge protein 53 [Balneolaceae bacterium]
MSYFSYFPNVYIGEGIGDNETFKYRLTKNIFRKVTTRDDLNQYTTLFEAYSVQPDETPSTLAQKYFQDPHLDWIILLVNEIIDLYDQWPKNQQDLIDYVNEKYTDPDTIHHYETNEILSDGDIFVRSGIQVTEDYTVELPDGSLVSGTNARYPLTNYEYEYEQNELKRQILIPQSSMIDLFIEEFEDLVGYEPHLELDEFNNKKTPLNIASRFLNNTGSTSYQNQGVTTPQNGNGAAVTFDNGVAVSSSSPSASVGVSTSVTVVASTAATVST